MVFIHSPLETFRVAKHLLRMKEGGGGSCCIMLPQYRPGLKVTVTWTDENGENEQSRVVEIPPYTPEDGDELHVHFLRNGEVKVFLTSLFLNNPAYPLKGDEKKL
jgi:hypothetical protein